MLTVPDEFAGQTMKCPMCDSAFVAPSLPGVAAAPPSEPEPDLYSVRADSPPLAPPPSVSSMQPPPPADLSPVPTPPPAATAPPSPPPAPGQPRVVSLSINPAVLPWIAPVCLLLVFFLQFFSWLGLYPGGVASVTQNAWQAAFGSYSMDRDLPNPAVSSEERDSAKPHVSVLTLFYMILFIPILLVTIASVVLPLIPIRFPPALENIWPWRWAIVAAANVILFFFLLLQLLLGFSLESRYGDWVDKQVQVDSKEAKSLPQQKVDSERGKYMQDLYRTFWLKFAVFLHLAAILGAALMYWIDRRGSARPLPQLELRW